MCPVRASRGRVTGRIDPNYEETPNIDVRLKFSNSTFDLSAADQALNPPPMFGPQTGCDSAGAGPGVTVYIVLEPVAAGPMGLGLLGLALAGRRR